MDDHQNNAVENGDHALDGERTIPSVSARRRPPFALIGIVVVVLTIAVTMFMVANKGDRKAELAARRDAEKAARDKDKTLGKHLPPIDFTAVANADPAPAIEPEAPPLPGNSDGKASQPKPDRDTQRLERQAAKAQQAAEKLAQKRLQASPLAYTQKHPNGADDSTRAMAGQLSSDDVNTSDRTADTDGLTIKLKATKVQGARAGVLPHPNFMLTKGHFLECTLEQAINSTLAGMLSCRLSNDVYSTNGKVVLLERGSRMTGEYQRGLMKGQARLFVLWTRAETPNGVIVDLDSPGTDALGRSGVDGYVNRHFLERFGSAIFLSLIDDVGQYAIAKAQEGNANQINLGGTAQTTQDMATEALKYSIDIPPTLEKNQGGHVSIYVARDLDFSDVYTLARQ